MRHGKRFNHLSRKSAHRRAMLANMASSLIEHKRIKTTLAKAKALRSYIEPLITKSKNDTTHSRRIVFSYLKQKDAITELFSEISTKIADRPGGYTRIIKLSNRLGDNAQMAFIELVDYNDDYATNKPKRKKSRRTRRKSSSEPTLNDNNLVKETNDEIIVKSDKNNRDQASEELASKEVKKEVDQVSEKPASKEVKKEVAQASEEPASKEVKKEVDQVIEESVSQESEQEKEDNKNPENQENKEE
ncbi:MAG: 50S ribosomal protein L17 [Flavobacteriales bacterium]|mgnify:FL=1|nr:50S ribosomal protein L17 [Flavobacteriales bacterium]|tara:strand:- start:26487 stop:27224 length:738 start_codon:yes stop_codon:yes gene_type:complete